MGLILEGSQPLLPAAAGGGTHTSGTLAARPASPAAGDTYAVTSGVASGDRYACYVAGAWTLVRSDVIGGFAPTLRWKLDETSGTTAANSGSATSANLTYSGTPKLGGFVGPRALRGASLLGDTQYAKGYGVTPTSTTAFSTFGVVDIVALTGAYQPLIVRRLATPGEPYSWYLGFANDVLTMYYRTAASGSIQTLTASSGYIPAGVHTIAAVWSAGTLKLYLDAVEVGSASPGSTLLWASAGSPEWQIGATGTAGERLNGKAAEVHVYDGTALTAVEVLELHGRMLGTYGGR